MADRNHRFLFPVCCHSMFVALNCTMATNSPCLCALTSCIAGMRLKFTQQIQDQTVKEGKTALFELELSHENVPVIWYRNEVKLHVSRTVLTRVEGRRHFLEMRSMSLDDTCQIKAEAKGIYSIAKLTVIGNNTHSSLFSHCLLFSLVTQQISASNILEDIFLY